MREQHKPIQHRLKTVLYFAIILLTLATVTPVLADYLGPNRTVVIQGGGSCQVELKKCLFVPAKNRYNYKTVNTWSCASESKAWLAYPSSGPACNASTVGAMYWEKQDNSQDETIIHPPATIDGSLENCTLKNGWCITPPQLSLGADEPLFGYTITAIEGTLNGNNFACPGADCSVPLVEGDNALTYWALSSWGDSSTMGSMTVKVDSQVPVISGAFSGTTGSNGWFLSPVAFTGSAADATSGLASFTCTLDGMPLGSCNSISVTDEGPHTVVLTAADQAGNSSMVAQDVSIDTRSPALTSSLQGTLGSNSWFNDAKLHASASDPIPGSGLFALEYRLDDLSWEAFPFDGILDLPEGKHAVDVRAVDQAGHSVSASKSFWLDSSAPIVVLDPQGTQGANGWYVTSLNLGASAGDNTSGVDIFEYIHNGSAWTTYTTPLVLTDGSHNVSFWAQDHAGLVTKVDRTYPVDTIRPQIAGSLSGTPGVNGWYISKVTLSASAADPLPGSGVDTFTYILDSSSETAYTNAVTISEGIHTIRLNVQDKAGLTYFTEQSLKVDTAPPTLSVESTIPNWVKGILTLTGSSNDSGSGLSKVEISTDGGQSWQVTSGTTSWNYQWDTTAGSNGLHNVIVRAVDQAGLTTQQTLPVAVDNQTPTIVVPASWLQWQTITLDIWDNESGLAEACVEISDPNGRWPKRTIRLDSAQFPLSFKWDRRFGDDTIAPNGKYDVTVTAIDQLGNVSRQSASVQVLIDILPAGPTATPQPYYRATPTQLATFTPIPTILPTETPAVVVSVFGEVQPAAQATSTPQVSSTSRATPTQTGILEWLESVLIPNTESTNQVTELGLPVSQAANSPLPAAGSTVLWGAAAAAMVGAVTSYTLEGKRKKEAPDEAQPAPHEPSAKVKAQKRQKLEAKWAQEEAWERARQTEFAIRGSSVKVDRDEHRAVVTQIIAKQQAAAEKKRAEEEKKKQERQDQLEAFYARQEQAESQIEQNPVKQSEKKWWEKAVDWIDDHQTEIALGIGVVAGVAAIVLSGGTATPLVAAAWIAGAAVVAGGTAALGTIALNVHYERDWKENILRNVLVAGVVATAVSGAGFLYQAVAGSAAMYCQANVNVCTRVEPILKFIDSIEELSLATQLGYQTLTHDPGAADTALELHMELIDSGMPGNVVGKELSSEAAEKLAKYGDDAIDLVKLYGDDGVRIILQYEDEGIALLQKYGDEIKRSTAKYGDDAVELFAKYDGEAVDFIKRAETLKTDPTNVLNDPPLQGQTLEGWLLGITDLENPVNKADTLKLSEEKVQDLLQNSLARPDSDEFVIGYFDPNKANGYEELADARGAIKLSMPQSLYNETGFQNNTGDFWPINRAAIQYGIDKRKTFVLSTDLDTILSNPQKYTYAEIQMILHPSSGYTYVHKDGYDMLIPEEILQP